MRILVTGGRDFADKGFVYKILDGIHAETPITKLVHGRAKGLDSLALQWAHDRGIPDEGHAADWGKHGKAAGPIRNQEMVDTKPDALVRFPGGAGTAHCAGAALKAGVRVLLPDYVMVDKLLTPSVPRQGITGRRTGGWGR